MTMDELFKALVEADNMRGVPTREQMLVERLFDDAVAKSLGYYPDWYSLTVQ